MAEDRNPFEVNQSPSRLEDNWNVGPVEQEGIPGTQPGQSAEPPGSLLAWGVCALIFGYVIPILGIAFAIVAFVKVSTWRKNGYWTRKMQTTRILAIAALILAAITIVVTWIQLRAPGAAPIGMILF